MQSLQLRHSLRNILHIAVLYKQTFLVKRIMDTLCVQELEKALQAADASVTELILDFAGLAYVSSAGLRVLLTTQKKMNKQGKMIIRNVCDDIKEIFEITGFLDILTIE